MEEVYKVRPLGGNLGGEVWMPGSKSIANRALILSVLGLNAIRLKNVPDCRDVRIMVRSLKKLGFKLEARWEEKEVFIEGEGAYVPKEEGSIDVGEAGTVARFIPPLLALREGGHYYLYGDGSIQGRPMRPVLDVLEHMNSIEVVYHEHEGYLPCSIRTRGLPGGVWEVDGGITSQAGSGLLMVGPFAQSRVELQMGNNLVSGQYFEMTRKMMLDWGILGNELSFEGGCAGYVYSEEGEYWIEGDYSSVAYWATLVLLVGGELTLKGVNMPTKTMQADAGFLKILEDFGLECDYLEEGLNLKSSGYRCGEEVLHYNMREISDTFLTLAAVGHLFCEELRLDGIRHTRFQETDRIHVVSEILLSLGLDVVEDDDGLVIRGEIVKGRYEVDPMGDHRVAMAFAILGSIDLCGDGQPWMTIKNPSCCSKSYPRFFEELDCIYESI